MFIGISGKWAVHTFGIAALPPSTRPDRIAPDPADSFPNPR